MRDREGVIMKISIVNVRFDDGEEIRMTPYAVSWFDRGGNLITQMPIERFLTWVRQKLAENEKATHPDGSQ